MNGKLWIDSNDTCSLKCPKNKHYFRLCDYRPLPYICFETKQIRKTRKTMDCLKDVHNIQSELSTSKLKQYANTNCIKTLFIYQYIRDLFLEKLIFSIKTCMKYNIK